MGNKQSFGVYVINLDKRKDRFEYINQILIKGGLSYKRISAIDGKKYKTVNEITEIDGYGDLKCLGNEDRTSNLAHTGCYMSHLKCLKMASTGMDERVLILEDDAKFIVDNFKNVIESIINNNRDADIIWFNAPHENEVIQKYVMPTWGLQGYLVTKKAAKILFDLLKPGAELIKDPCLIDIVMPMAVKNAGLSWRFFSLIAQNTNFESNISGS